MDYINLWTYHDKLHLFILINIFFSLEKKSWNMLSKKNIINFETQNAKNYTKKQWYKVYKI